MLVNTNPGLKFNLGFFFFSSKALSWIIFSIFFSIPNHQIVGKKIQLNWLLKLSYLSSKFSLTRGYLNPASNNLAQKVIFIRALSTELTNHTLLTLWLQECWCVDLEVTVSNSCRTTSHGLAPGLRSAVRKINHHSVDKGNYFALSCG